MPDTRVSQVGAEVFFTGPVDTVVSQVGVELFFPPLVDEEPNPAFPAAARVSQQVVEYVIQPEIDVRVSQQVVEYAAQVEHPLRLAQQVIEYIPLNIPPPPPFEPPDGCPVDLPIGSAGSGACAPTWTP